MGVYTRKGSPYYWIWLEGTSRPFSSKIPIGEGWQKRHSRQTAEDIYHAAMGDLARGTFQIPTTKPQISFKQWAEWYREHVTDHHRSKARAKSMIKSLIAHFGDTPLHQLDRHAIDEWKSARVQQVKPATVNRELELLKPLLQRAVGKYLKENPAKEVKRFKTKLPPIAILSPSAEDALLEHATAEERAFVLLGLDALLRMGDVRRLHLDHDKGTHLVIVDPKTDPYMVPVSARLRAALDKLKMKAELRGGFYFARKYGKKWAPMNRNTGFLFFAALCDRANVPRGREIGGITFHGLRHTGATRAANHVKLTVVQRLGGWKNLKQLARYDHPDDPAMIRAVEAIGSRPTPPAKQRNAS